MVICYDATHYVPNQDEVPLENWVASAARRRSMTPAAERTQVEADVKAWHAARDWQGA